MHADPLPAGAVAGDTTGNAAEATLTVERIAAPSVTKAFNPATARVGDPVRLTITLTNPNAEAVTDVAFTDSYPANLVNALSPQAESTCGGIVTAAPNGTSLALSGGTIPASGACTVAVFVTATAAGNLVNDLPAGAVTSSNADPSPAAAATLAAVNPEAIPTLGEWAILTLIALFATFAVLRLRA